MSKEQKCFIVLIAIIIILASSFGIYAFLHKDKKVCKEKETDAIKFKKEYEKFNGKTYEDLDVKYFDVKLSSNNIFKYIKADDAVEFLSEGTGVIYFGFPQCPWCRTLVPYLQSIGESTGIKEIYYLNISDIRDSYEVEGKKVVKSKDGSREYYQILKLLDKYLEEYYVTNDNGKKFDTGVKRLYAPTTVVVKKGKIIDFLEGTVDSQKKFAALTKEEKSMLKKRITNMFIKISAATCSETSC